MIASVSAMEKQMNEPLETGRLYRVALTPLAALRARVPCRLTLRYVARKPRHDALHGKFVGWQAVFRTVEVMPAKEMEFGLAEEGFIEADLDQIGMLTDIPDEEPHASAYQGALEGEVAIIRFR